jgi:radical SAM superfamily enzyme YgiQ (UPF0313 family)
MNVVLFNASPHRGLQPSQCIELPLSLLFPATPLDRAGYRVTIIDESVNRNWRRDLEEALKTKLICFGVTCMTGPQILHALAVCKLVRERQPDAPIVWGGVHASILAEQTLQNPLVDIVVVGEGENTFIELVKALESGTPLAQVKGIAFRENGKVTFTGGREFVDMDALPPLTYRLIDMNRYRRQLFGIDHITFNSSRGCTASCSFCWDPVMHRRQFRAMRAGTVLDHIQRMMRDYGLRGFGFNDDNFFVDLRRAHDIFEGMVRAGLNLSIAKLHIRVDTVCKMEAEFLDLMRRAGVRTISLGVESGSPRLLELVNKRITVDQVVEANRRLHRHGIAPSYTFMMGLPEETTDELGQTIRLALKLADENPEMKWGFNVYTPYPGTQLYDLLVTKYGFKPPGRLEDWGQYNYRDVRADASWVPKETKRLIRALDFPLICNAQAKAMASYKRINPIIALSMRAYAPLARHRVRHLDARFPIETKLVRALGLFGRRD